jgi:cytochrome c oxidase cbb3-type subunit 3
MKKRMRTYRQFLRILLVGGGVMLCFSAELHAQIKDADSTQTAASASAVFATNCAGCHGSDGRGGERAPNIATNHEIIKLSDERLNEILTQGVLASGMPAFGSLGKDKVQQLVRYLRSLQGFSAVSQTSALGNPHTGEQLFFGFGSCGHCHMVNGRGGFFAEDLSSYAKGRSAAVLREAILHPEEGANAVRMVHIELTSGNVYSGLIRFRDNFNIVLQSEDGFFHSIERSSIRNIKANQQPLMPQDYSIRLSASQIDDLVSYLLSIAATSKSVLEKAEKDN